MPAFSLPGALRRVRRRADLSQRELAEACGVSQSAVAQAESGRRDLPTGVLTAAVALAGLRLALLDEDGREVREMSTDAVRDMAGRRFPAHLDTRYGDEGWWHDAHHYGRPRPWYTFTRDRVWRDRYRAAAGVPDDHLLPQPGDSPAERAETRRLAALRLHAEEAAQRRATELKRRRAAGEPLSQDPFTCTCPAACDGLDDWSGRPVHVDDCPCSCDVG